MIEEMRALNGLMPRLAMKNVHWRHGMTMEDQLSMVAFDCGIEVEGIVNSVNAIHRYLDSIK